MYLGQYLFASGPPPPAPFPNLGCDCTIDNIEPCCSPDVSQIVGVSVYQASSASYDESEPFDYEYPPYVHPGTPKQIDLRVINYANCSHEETRSYWWALFGMTDDTSGAQADAFNDDCLKLEATITLAADFVYGSSCMGSHGEQEDNSLCFYLPPMPDEVLFIFTDGGTTQQEEASDVDRVDPYDAHIQYYYDPDDEQLHTYNVVNTCRYKAELTDVEHISGSQCWHLKEVKIVDIIDDFDRSGDADIATTEEIKKYAAGGYGYSVELSSVKYVWCP